MSKETLGYVQLEWTCPRCNTRNPGLEKLCRGCGAAQPQNVQFEQAAQESLITDEKMVASAKAGPDVHCIYCGTRNPAGAETCKQCGADLTQAVTREHGRVVGAHRAEPAPAVHCPSCGSENEATALRCQTCGASLAETRRPDAAPTPEPAGAPRKSRRGLWIGIGVAALALIVVYFILAGRTEDLVGRVQEIYWMRSIGIETQQPVSHEDWHDEIPAGGVLVGCQERLHHTESEPVANAKKVCGTPYTVDLGSGAGEVVQDCEYEVYADWCEYTLQEWQEVDAYVLTGDDHSPVWPELTLGDGEREGERLEVYTVIFVTEDDSYTYEAEDLDEYNQYQVGSQWLLEVNTFNHLVGVAPAP
jgi:ribosomal protein L40E